VNFRRPGAPWRKRCSGFHQQLQVHRTASLGCGSICLATKTPEPPLRPSVPVTAGARPSHLICARITARRLAVSFGFDTAPFRAIHPDFAPHAGDFPRRQSRIFAREGAAAGSGFDFGGGDQQLRLTPQWTLFSADPRTEPWRRLFLAASSRYAKRALPLTHVARFCQGSSRPKRMRGSAARWPPAVPTPPWQIFLFCESMRVLKVPMSRSRIRTRSHPPAFLWDSRGRASGLPLDRQENRGPAPAGRPLSVILSVQANRRRSSGGLLSDPERHREGRFALHEA